MKKCKFKNRISRYENGEFFFDEEDYTYSMFFKQYLWVHIVLVSLLAISMFLTVAVYSGWFRQCENLRSADCWNSVISYAVSYIGATFLGLIVFYNTRQRQHFEDKESKLKIFFTSRPRRLEPLEFYTEEDIGTVKAKCWGGSNSENTTLAYIKFNVRNYNYKFPMFIEFSAAYYADENGNILKANGYCFAMTTDTSMPLDYKEESDIYIGIDAQLFGKLPQRIAYVFKCRNVKNVEKYYAYFITFFDTTCGGVVKSFDVEEYNNSLKNEKQPFGRWKIYLTTGQGNK